MQNSTRLGVPPAGFQLHDPTMIECSRGLAITTTSQKAADAIDGFTHALLAHTDNAPIALEAPRADPECVLANSIAAALMMMGETAHAPGRARPYVESALMHLRGATRRERFFALAVAAWQAGDVPLALRYHGAILEHWPDDALNIKLAQHHCFNRGDAAGIRWFAERGHRHNPNCAYVQGMYAFGLEQTGDLSAAERAARDASDRELNNPWAHHAVAHVLFSRQQHLQALAFLYRKSRTWDHCSSFMYTHNWWHTALAALGTGSTADVLALYDAHVWTRDISQTQPQINAAGLLARFELAGIGTGNRWQPVARKAREHMHDHVHGYLDLHFMLALTGAGEDMAARSMLRSMEEHAATRLADGDLTWQHVVVPAARAVIAFHHDELETAAHYLRTALPGLHLAGGSNTQRDLFTQYYDRACAGITSSAA